MLGMEILYTGSSVIPQFWSFMRNGLTLKCCAATKTANRARSPALSWQTSRAQRDAAVSSPSPRAAAHVNETSRPISASPLSVRWCRCTWSHRWSSATGTMQLQTGPPLSSIKGGQRALYPSNSHWVALSSSSSPNLRLLLPLPFSPAAEDRYISPEPWQTFSCCYFFLYYLLLPPSPSLWLVVPSAHCAPLSASISLRFSLL